MIYGVTADNTALGAGAGTDSSTSSSSSSSSSDSTSEVTKTEFLQLLVAQIKNQDPLNPQDGTQFLSQLAQFEQLEQSMNTGEDVTAIRNDIESATASSSSTTTASS